MVRAFAYHSACSSSSGTSQLEEGEAEFIMQHLNILFDKEAVLIWGFVMAKVSLTYDGFQHATSVQTERKNARGKTVGTDCPYTGKGEEFSPLELTGSGVAGCCLISMGTLAMRRKIDISGTRLDVELSWTERNDRIGAIDLTFNMAKNFSPKERIMLERAADACPIKHSFHPDTKITTRFVYSE